MSSTNSIPNEQVVFTDFDGSEGLLIDLNTKKYYQLNESAMLIWKALEKKRRLSEIVEDLTAAYEVSPEQAAVSVERFLNKIQLYKLVS